LAAAWAFVVSGRVSLKCENDGAELPTQREAEEHASCLAAEDDGNEDDEEIGRTIFSLKQQLSSIPERQAHC
jgi:hypothetical protein